MIRIDGVRHKLDAIDPNAALFMTRELEAVEAENISEIIDAAVGFFSYGAPPPPKREQFFDRLQKRGHGRVLPAPLLVPGPRQQQAGALVDHLLGQ